ncbi:MAG: glycosyltransferase 87 family protein [Nitrososphaerota archaeon]
MVNRRLTAILLSAFILRLVFSPFFGHPWDMYIWIKSGELALSNINIYLKENPVDYPWGFYAYPPVWLFWLAIVAMLRRIVENMYFTIFMIKLPIIISDILVGFLIYGIVKKLGYGEKKSLILTSIWLFNPIVFFVSSIWGMFDSIAVLFMVASLSSILDRKYMTAGVLTGIGIAVKILPALLIPPTLVYLIKLEKEDKKKILLNLLVAPLIVFLLISLPFLSTPLQYLTHILQHAESVGTFTYWTALSTVINTSIFWFVPIVVYVVALAASFRKFPNNVNEYIRILGATVLTFIAMSPKVNIQHTLTFIPLILLYYGFTGSRETLYKFTQFMVTGVIWLASSVTILSNYSIDYIGKIYTPDTYDFGIGAVTLVVSSVLGGIFMVRLMLDLLNLGMLEFKLITSRWGIIGIIVSFLLVLSIMATPTGVVLPRTDIRIGIPESVDSAFIPRNSVSVDSYLKHYDVNYVVLTWSPDFVNTYDKLDYGNDITEYTRFRTGSNKWTVGDVIWLINELHSRNVKVLLGVYLKIEKIKPHYSVQGYSTDWVKNHPEVISESGILLFNNTIEIDNVSSRLYSEYFAEKITRLIRDMNFDGVYLMGWSGWKENIRGTSHILPLIKELRNRGKLVFVEGPESTYCIEETIKLIESSDYVVLKTAPWVYTIYYARTDNTTLTDYKNYVNELLLRIGEDGRKKVLFSLYIFDFVDGWTTPATQLYVESREFYGMGLTRGYALYYTSRYVPYKLSVELNPS